MVMDNASQQAPKINQTRSRTPAPSASSARITPPIEMGTEIAIGDAKSSATESSMFSAQPTVATNASNSIE